MCFVDVRNFSGYNKNTYQNRDDGERPRRRFAKRAGDWCKSGEGARRGITSERQAERLCPNRLLPGSARYSGGV